LGYQEFEKFLKHTFFLEKLTGLEQFKVILNFFKCFRPLIYFSSFFLRFFLSQEFEKRSNKKSTSGYATHFFFTSFQQTAVWEYP
jgi:hypothetical protein